MFWNTGGVRSPVRRVEAKQPSHYLYDVPMDEDHLPWKPMRKGAAELREQIPVKAVTKVTSSSEPGTKQKWEWSNDIFQYEAEERQIVLGKC